MAWSKGELAVAKKSEWRNARRGDLHSGYDMAPRKGGIYRVEQVVRMAGREFLKPEEFPVIIFIASAFEKLSPASSEFTEKIKGFGSRFSRREKERETA